MIGVLSADEIEQILSRNSFGHLAVSHNDLPYVVPLNYSYDGTSLYGYSGHGRKIDTMRIQPRVSIGVDELDGPSGWRSVILEAVYEELTDPEERHAAVARLARSNGSLVPRNLTANGGVVLFRLRPTGKSGRFEQIDD